MASVRSSLRRSARGNGAGNLADFQRMGQPGPVVVPFRREKDLGLLLEAPEGLAVQDPVPVPLKARADRVRFLRQSTAAAAASG